MTLSNNGIEEFQVNIYKKSGFKKVKNLRVLLINTVPHIQLVSKNSRRITEINISGAIKVFTSFTLDNYEKIFHIILKEKIWKFMIDDPFKLKQCVNLIDEILLKYHQRKKSNLSELNNNVVPIESNMSGTNSPARKKSNLSELNNNVVPIESNMSGTNSSAESNESIHRKNPLENYFSMDYQVPAYIPGEIPLKGGYEQLEKNPFTKKKSKTDSNIFIVMKIREEISHSSGVKVLLSDCDVNVFEVKQIEKEIWVSQIRDWNKIDGRLHVGDKIISVNDIIINDTFYYNELTRNQGVYEYIIQRLPNAKVFVFDKTKSEWRNKVRCDGQNFSMRNKSLKKNQSFQITEINRKNTLNLKDTNTIQNIQAMIQVDIPYLAIIMHTETFINTLTVQNKKKHSKA